MKVESKATIEIQQKGKLTQFVRKITYECKIVGI